MDTSELLREKARTGSINIDVRPGSPATRLVSYNQDRDCFRVEVSARPDKNKANQELVKFLSSLLGQKVRIKSGHSSRRKTVQVV